MTDRIIDVTPKKGILKIILGILGVFLIIGLIVVGFVFALGIIIILAVIIIGIVLLSMILRKARKSFLLQTNELILKGSLVLIAILIVLFSWYGIDKAAANGERAVYHASNVSTSLNCTFISHTNTAIRSVFTGEEPSCGVILEQGTALVGLAEDVGSVGNANIVGSVDGLQKSDILSMSATIGGINAIRSYIIGLCAFILFIIIVGQGRRQYSRSLAEEIIRFIGKTIMVSVAFLLFVLIQGVFFMLQRLG